MHLSSVSLVLSQEIWEKVEKETYRNHTSQVAIERSCRHMCAMIYYPDGSHKPVSPKNGTDFSLEELRAIVGGYIEVIYLPDSIHIMVINEEGRVKNLPRNEKATQLVGFLSSDEIRKRKLVYEELGYHVIDTTYGQEQYIAGNALVCLSSEVQ